MLLSLHRLKLFNVDSSELNSLPSPIFDILNIAGLIETRTGCWSNAGRIVRGHAIYFGMVGSYFATLKNLHALIFGGVTTKTHSQLGQVEVHVDRELNILASAAAHQNYFAADDDIIADIFERLPIESQPSYVMDMGCGDGSWLVHIHRTITERTIRGQYLDKYPLLMVGVDYNAVCKSICLETFAKNNVRGEFILGDITNPAALANTVASQGLGMRNGLHVRSFIDHNRIYKRPQSLPSTKASLPTGTYINVDDQPICPADLRQNLIEFLSSWAPYAHPHGLLIIEAHCIAPDLTVKHLGEVHSLVFDTYHAFSRQYPVDFDVFMECAEEAGLQCVPHQQHRFPSRKPFVAISANQFIQRKPTSQQLNLNKIATNHTHCDQWMPESVIPSIDGRALHNLLYKKGDLQRPRPWCRDSTGRLLGDVLRQIARILNSKIDHAPDKRVIHIIDYGSGSCMATLELLQAMNQNGFLQRLEKYNFKLRLSMVDIPSDWFAMGYHLLSDYKFVEFYSLRDSNGQFKQLCDLFGPDSVDIIISSMVFHLVPESALPRLFKDLASILVPGGLLAWNSPDIGPPGDDAILFHDVNRDTRKKLLAFIEKPETIRDEPWLDASTILVSDLIKDLHHIKTSTTVEQRAAMALSANKQILTVSNNIDQLIAIARVWFDCSSVKSRNYEILPDELLDLSLVPSNRRYYAEIAKLPYFEDLLSRLILESVIPSLRDGNARSHSGLSIHWTFGTWFSRAGGL